MEFDRIPNYFKFVSDILVKIMYKPKGELIVTDKETETIIESDELFQAVI